MYLPLDHSWVKGSFLQHTSLHFTQTEASPHAFLLNHPIYIVQGLIEF